MEKEWEPVQFEIIAYKETGTYILRSSEDTSQLLDDHIVMTQSMSFSPYKKPFEERINTWENKLTTTQVSDTHNREILPVFLFQQGRQLILLREAIKLPPFAKLVA